MIEEKAKDYIKKLKIGLDKMDLKAFDEILRVIYNAWKNGNQVFIFGNGGSASTASHMACDLGKGTLKNVYNNQRKRMRVISLTDNVATMMAYSNDLEYGDVFKQQLMNLVNKGDVAIGITGSGNSPNVVSALEYAQESGAITIGLLGFGGGKVKEIVDHCIIFPENHYGRVEDAHMILSHMLTEFLADIMEKQEQ